MRKIKPLLQEERSKEYNFDEKKTVSTARLIPIPESTDAILDQRGRPREYCDCVWQLGLTLAEIHIVNRGAWMRPDL